MSLSGAKFSKIAVLGGGVSSKDKKTWKVKVAKQFKKMGGSGQQAEKGDKSSAQAQSYPEGGSIGVPVSFNSTCHFWGFSGQIALQLAKLGFFSRFLNQFCIGILSKLFMILSNCIQIEECPLDEDLRVPLLVRTCCGVVEERGLEVVGVYRVPGNSAAVNQLTEQVNRGEFRSVSRHSQTALPK